MHFMITGASRGLGLAITEQALACGWQVDACARSTLPATLQSAQTSGQLRWSCVDMGDHAAALHWLAQALAGMATTSAGPLQLVLNAAILEPIAAISELAADDLQRHLAVNLGTPMLLAGAFAKYIAEHSVNGRLLAVSSGAARRPAAHWGAYCASKAGLDMLVRVLKVEAEAAGYDQRFKAVALAPGVVDTAMQADIRQHQFPGVQRFVDLHAAGGLTSPSVAAQAILGYLQAADFGAVEVDDIRNYPA